jgi:hypothetical protein
MIDVIIMILDNHTNQKKSFKIKVQTRGAKMQKKKKNIFPFSNHHLPVAFSFFCRHNICI